MSVVNSDKDEQFGGAMLERALKVCVRKLTARVKGWGL